MDNAAQDGEQSLRQLERQTERGSLFTHTVLSSHADRLQEAETMLYGLIDALVAKGMLTAEEVADKAEAVQQELRLRGHVPGIGVALRVDGETADDDYIPVNCAERIHICKAVCCRLNFALSAPEIEAGVVKWDLGHPYYIRHEHDGYCTHQDRATRGCGVYGHRPHVCRQYSCANDERIWKDFEAMELNEEWLTANLGGADGPRLVQASMMLISPASIAQEPGSAHGAGERTGD